MEDEVGKFEDGKERKKEGEKMLEKDIDEYRDWKSEAEIGL